ncbi:hypothetical protein ACMX25_16930 [Caballeronia sp. 15715]|uniref:hypothetical protein n=1 Tax=Caballeronia sp. 15715 TaxID=3391030 RepID=UPI0039E61C54
MKADREFSLRAQVEKWLMPRLDTSLHVTLIRYTGSSRVRSARVESRDGVNSHVLFFFQNAEGHWSIFPPRSDRPMMGMNAFAPLNH